MMRVGLVAGMATALVGFAPSAASAVTPGWECIPTTAGHAVVSGGTGTAPACAAGSTAVLAPTFVSSGVGGRPTVQFSAVNVQIVSGSGKTAGKVNGEGNLVVGYAEDTSGRPQTGSNDLIVGSENGWKSFGQIVGGFGNNAAGTYASAFGTANAASGAFSLVAGQSNKATGNASSVTGGHFNLASDSFASIVGGCGNLAGPGSVLSGSCVTGAEAVLGGFENTASGLESTVSGGELGTANGGAASVAGGQFNVAHGGGASVSGGNGNNASGSFASILGGFENSATTFEATVAGGETNSADANESSILGGEGNTATGSCQAIPAAPIGSC